MYKYGELQVSNAIQKLSCKTDCKTPLFSDSVCQTNLLIAIHHRNLKQGMERRLGLESCMDITFWAFYGKVKRRDVLSSYVCSSIVQFLIDNTRVNPNVKNVIKKHLC